MFMGNPSTPAFIEINDTPVSAALEGAEFFSPTLARTCTLCINSVKYVYE